MSQDRRGAAGRAVYYYRRVDVRIILPSASTSVFFFLGIFEIAPAPKIFNGTRVPFTQNLDLSLSRIFKCHL